MAVVDLHYVVAAYQELSRRRRRLDRFVAATSRRLRRAQAKLQRLLANEGRTEPSPAHKRAARLLLVLVITLLPIVTYFYVQSIGGLITARLPDFDGRFDVLGFLTASPINVVLAAGCAAFVAAAKIVEIVYSKLHYPKTYFLAISLIAVLLVGGNGVIVSRLAADNGKLSDFGIAIEKIERQVQRLITRLTRDDAPVAACSGADQDPPECAEVAALHKKRGELEESAERVRVAGIQAVEFWWRLIALLGEIFIAGVAFCAAADVHGRQQHLERLRINQEAVVAALTTELAGLNGELAAIAHETAALASGLHPSA